MKKPIVAFAALIIAAGASIGAYMAVMDKQKKDDKKAEEAAQSLVLFDFDAESINKLEINSEGKDYTIEKAEDQWVITEGDVFPLEQDYIDLICSYSSTLTASAEYDGDPADYGLDSPDTVTLYGSDQSYTLNVGTLSPTSDYFYVNTGDRDGVFSVASISGSALELKRSMLHSRAVTQYSAEDIAGYTIIKDGSTTLEIRRSPEGSWLAPEGYEKFNIDYSSISSMTSVVTHIIIQDILEYKPEDLSPYGLDKPKAEVIIKGYDGVEHRLLVSEPCSNRDYSYVYLCDDDQVVYCYTGDIDFIDYTPYSFMLQTYSLPRYTDTTGFELSFNGREDSFTIDNENNSGTINGTAFDMNNSDIGASFQTFYLSLTTFTVTSVDNGSGPELKDPMLTAVLHNNDGTDTKYELMDAGDNTAYLFIDGEYSGYNVSTDSLNGKNSLVNFFEKFRDSIGMTD